MQNYIESRPQFYNQKICFNRGRHKLYLDIAMGDYIRDIGYSGDFTTDELLQVEEMCSEVRSQSLESLEDVISKKSFINEALLALSWALGEFTGENRQQEKMVDPHTLICRCQGIDEKTLLDSIEFNIGDRKKIIAQTGIAQVCGSCTHDLTQALGKSEWAKYFFQGKSNAHWLLQAQTLLDNWYVAGNSTFNKLNKEVLSVKAGLVKIKLVGERAEMKRDELNQTFSNFLKENLNSNFKASVTF